MIRIGQEKAVDPYPIHQLQHTAAVVRVVVGEHQIVHLVLSFHQELASQLFAALLFHIAAAIHHHGHALALVDRTLSLSHVHGGKAEIPKINGRGHQAQQQTEGKTAYKYTFFAAFSQQKEHRKEHIRKHQPCHHIGTVGVDRSVGHVGKKSCRPLYQTDGPGQKPACSAAQRRENKAQDGRDKAAAENKTDEPQKQQVGQR